MKNTENKNAMKTVDAAGRTLGRVASDAAKSLMGKDLVTFERNVYTGSPVTIINANQLKITTKKLEEIYHTRYSGVPGGLRILTGTHTAKTKGYRELIKMATEQMLPDNKIRREMMKNLKIVD